MNRLDMPDSYFDLDVPEMFRFDSCLNYLSRSPLECLYKIDGERITRLLRIGSQSLLFDISAHGSQSLRIQPIKPACFGDDVMQDACQYVSDWFDFGRDLNPFYRLAETSPIIGELTDAFYGLRLMGIPDLFEALCWAIMGQQINLTFAYTLKKRFTEAYGESLEWQGKKYWSFPPAERVFKVELDELCGLQLTRAKAASILSVAGLMASGELSREKLLSLSSFEAAGQALMGIRGIGPWTRELCRNALPARPARFSDLRCRPAKCGEAAAWPRT